MTFRILLTSGEYSNYVVDCLLERERAPDGDEQKRIAARYKEILREHAEAHNAWAMKVRGGLPADGCPEWLGSCWKRILISEFGFFPAVFEEWRNGP